MPPIHPACIKWINPSITHLCHQQISRLNPCLHSAATTIRPFIRSLPFISPERVSRVTIELDQGGSVSGVIGSTSSTDAPSLDPKVAVVCEALFTTMIVLALLCYLCVFRRTLFYKQQGQSIRAWRKIRALMTDSDKQKCLGSNSTNTSGGTDSRSGATTNTSKAETYVKEEEEKERTSKVQFRVDDLLRRDWGSNNASFDTRRSSSLSSSMSSTRCNTATGSRASWVSTTPTATAASFWTENTLQLSQTPTPIIPRSTPSSIVYAPRTLPTAISTIAATPTITLLQQPSVPPRYSGEAPGYSTFKSVVTYECPSCAHSPASPSPSHRPRTASARISNSHDRNYAISSSDRNTESKGISGKSIIDIPSSTVKLRFPDCDSHGYDRDRDPPEVPLSSASSLKVLWESFGLLIHGEGNGSVPENHVSRYFRTHTRPYSYPVYALPFDTEENRDEKTGTAEEGIRTAESSVMTGAAPPMIAAEFTRKPLTANVPLWQALPPPAPAYFTFASGVRMQ